MCKVRGATNGNCEKESAGGKKDVFLNFLKTLKLLSKNYTIMN